MKKILLSEDQLPDRWYNILPDLPEPLGPFLHPGDPASRWARPTWPRSSRWRSSSRRSRRSAGSTSPTRCATSTGCGGRRRSIAPTGWRRRSTPRRGSTSSTRASPPPARTSRTPRCRRRTTTPPRGSHRLTTETGAGQWGSALAFAGALFGVEVFVYMVRISYDQKPYRRAMMETWGAQVAASPTDRTTFGRSRARARPGVAGQPRHRHLRGGRGGGDPRGHPLLARLGGQPRPPPPDRDRARGDQADGDRRRLSRRRRRLRRRRLQLRRPRLSLRRRAAQRRHAGTRFVAAEPAACPTLTRGVYAYDFGDTAGMGPVVPMHTLGHNFVPDPIHAGGLRYHGDAPSLCTLVRHGIVEARAYNQNECFAEAVRFARTEGFLPGPEPSHALRAVAEEAEAARRGGRGPDHPRRPLRPRALRHVRL